MREGLIMSAAMCLFGLFASQPLPLFSVSLAGLLVVAGLLGRSLQRGASPRAVFGWPPFARRVGLSTAIGCVLGLLLGECYRQAYGLALFPLPLAWFVVPAALIGGFEELVYRGYIQGQVGISGFLLAPAFAALSHTAYKCALFLFPSDGIEICLTLLASLTFAFGFIIGLLRQVSGSVLPPLVAHVLFDVLAYGDRQAPWWVWR